MSVDLRTQEQPSPVVSVIIPTFNSAAYLADAIQSVLDQTYTNFELMIVDDGSTDDTGSVVARFKDERVHYIYQANQGRSLARNRGLTATSGEYVVFLDADDLLAPHKLEVQVDCLEQSPDIGLVAGGFSYIAETGELIDRVEPWLVRPNLDIGTWLYGCPFVIHAVLVRRCWLERVNGFNLTLSHLEDWDLWLRLSYASCRMAWIEDIVCSYRMHDGQTIRQATKQRDSTLAVLDSFFAQSDLLAELCGLKENVYAHAYVRSACREYGAGEDQIARSDLERALTLDPTLLGNDGEPLLSLLLGWVAHPVVGEPYQYVRRVFTHLPEAAFPLLRFRRKAFAQAAMFQFFRAHLRQDWKATRRHGLRGIWYDPSWLRNLGVISIGLNAVFGPDFMQHLRRWLPSAKKRPVGN